MNIVHLTGRIGGDPEIRTFQNGDRVANFSLATEERWKDRQTGEKRSKTTWHPVSIFTPGTIKFLEGYVKKGDLLQLVGSLEVQEWTDQEQKKRRATKIVVRTPRHGLEKLAGKREAEPAAGGSDQGGGFAPDPDDEIPF